MDFNDNDGDFTVVSAHDPGGPWTWSAATGKWSCYDQDGCGLFARRGSWLTSPILTVATPGLLEVAFEHRYSFEADADTRWDGGQFRISVNGGADSEGLTNKQEYQSGTNPTDRDSYLKVERIAVTGETRIEFIAASNLTYTVEYTESLKNVVWHTLADVVAGPTSRTVLVTDPGASAQRFYRLVTPRMSNGN